MIPQLHEKPPVNSSAKTLVLGGFFWLFLASTILGAILSRPPSNDPEPMNQFESSFTLPTPDSAADSGITPIRLDVVFPPALDPCNVDALTLIPEEVDPYDLPPIYPIDDWFNRHEFVNRAFARVSVTNTKSNEDVQVANGIITRVTQREEISGTYNAAYTICNTQSNNELPQIDIHPGGQVAGERLGEEQYINLRPWNREVFEVEVASMEPGFYEVEVGVEYLEGDKLVQVWSPEPIHLYTPQRFHRWSAGVVTYWGMCSFESGEYICEELEYEEPILVTEVTSDAEAGEAQTSEDTDPRTCRPAPTTRLSVGIEATVSYRLSLRLRIREAPGLSSNVITAMNRGTQMEIVDGPVCQDGYLWWKIEKDNAITGWSAEGEPRMYYLEP